MDKMTFETAAGELWTADLAPLAVRMFRDNNRCLALVGGTLNNPSGYNPVFREENQRAWLTVELKGHRQEVDGELVGSSPSVDSLNMKEDRAVLAAALEAGALRPDAFCTHEDMAVERFFLESALRGAVYSDFSTDTAARLDTVRDRFPPFGRMYNAMESMEKCAHVWKHTDATSDLKEIGEGFKLGHGLLNNLVVLMPRGGTFAALVVGVKRAEGIAAGVAGFETGMPSYEDELATIGRLGRHLHTATKQATRAAGFHWKNFFVDAGEAQTLPTKNIEGLFQTVEKNLLAGLENFAREMNVLDDISQGGRAPGNKREDIR